MLLILVTALAMAQPVDRAGAAFGPRAGLPFTDVAPLPTRWGCFGDAGALYMLDGNTITDPVTGWFSVTFNYIPAAEIQRTTLLLARGPRPIPRTSRPPLPSARLHVTGPSR